MAHSPAGIIASPTTTKWYSCHPCRGAEMFIISKVPIDIARLQSELEGAGVGAVVCFEGRVRDNNDGRAVDGLSYKAYVELAEFEGRRIVDEARKRFAVAHIVCVHRVGDLALGDVAVWAGVSAAHRGAAFDACRYVIDQVKLRVPIWKREHYVGGSSEWLHPEAE
ncbi:MAG: molybdenum cofactor biosynthesis protein MoaE [Xanthomonadaceae bacterium]|nr:molybdenum cofactor biosynthesis protein MoaE [Xanthomonadaceae bacterium]